MKTTLFSIHRRKNGTLTWDKRVDVGWAHLFWQPFSQVVKSWICHFEIKGLVNNLAKPVQRISTENLDIKRNLKVLKTAGDPKHSPSCRWVSITICLLRTQCVVWKNRYPSLGSFHLNELHPWEMRGTLSLSSKSRNKNKQKYPEIEWNLSLVQLMIYYTFPNENLQYNGGKPPRLPHIPNPKTNKLGRFVIHNPLDPWPMTHGCGLYTIC